MSEQHLDAEAILETLSRLQTVIPASMSERVSDRVTPVETVEDFEYQSVIDALEVVATGLEVTINTAEAKLIDDCLRVYYAAVELARDPAHAHLTAHVEAMRAAYERDFGRAIPTREEWEGEA